jgi:hypothetical protein
MVDGPESDLADVPPVWHPQRSHEQNSCRHDDNESLGEGVYDDFVKWCDKNLPRAHFDEVDQEATGSEDITLHAASSSTFNDDAAIYALPFDFPPTSSPTDKSMRNEDINAIGAIGNCHHNSDRVVSDIERGINIGEGTDHIGYCILDQGSCMRNTLLNTPAGPDIHDKQRSARNPLPQYFFKPRNPDRVQPQYPAVAHQLAPVNQQQMSHISMGKANGTSVAQAPTLQYTSLSDMSWRSRSSYAPLTSALTNPPLGNHSWNVHNQQRGRGEAGIATGSYPFTQYSHAIPNLPIRYDHRQIANEAGAKAYEEQYPRLMEEMTSEVRLHLRVLTSYFSHALKFLLRDCQRASSHAIWHWLESARHWERTVPLEWRARMPPPSSDDVVVNVLRRHHWIQSEMEKNRLQSLPLGLHQQHARESEVDSRLTALRIQEKVMKVWTRMFVGMLHDLRFNFPLFEDTLREFYLTNNWSHLDAPRC